MKTAIDEVIKRIEVIDPEELEIIKRYGINIGIVPIDGPVKNRSVLALQRGVGCGGCNCPLEKALKDLAQITRDKRANSQRSNNLRRRFDLDRKSQLRQQFYTN